MPTAPLFAGTRLLWSKALAGGGLFDLNDARRGVNLHHRSQLGEFFLGSDSVIPTFARWGFAKAHPELYTEEENKAFMAMSNTIGGMMVFPANRIQGKWTINQARGCLKRISDRFDLTVECIRPTRGRSTLRACQEIGIRITLVLVEAP